MKPFMDADFLLQSDTAKNLFHSYAKDMPIVDYHCHVPPNEIVEDRNFENIAQAWLGGGGYGDHYKWRLMRANGIEEKYITGDASDREKFQKFAETLPRMIGNPVYHWAHLELQRYFNCNIPLNASTAQQVWDQCNSRIASGELTVRKIIKMSKVVALCTTDDPIDSLEYHKIIRNDQSFDVKVLPAFRPDKSLNLDKPDFAEYIGKLSRASGIPINEIDDLYSALSSRLDYFDSMGCRASDHGLDYVICREDMDGLLESIFQKALKSQPLAQEEIDIYKTALMLFFGRQYARRGWVMQMHYGAIRNTNTLMYQRLGADTGFDCISTRECSRDIVSLLDALNKTNELPRVVLYSLNPNDDAMLASVINCFQEPGVSGKIQHGTPWWFNDTKPGMESQITSLASLALFGNFIGMLTDSRSFLSYTRHEYFRRILCNQIGNWVENGEYPNDIEALGKLVEDISFNNAMRFLGLD